MKEEIREFLAEHIADHELADDDNFFEMGLVNSLFVLQLVMFVEQAFEVELEGDDLDLNNFCTINTIVSLVERLTAVPA